MNDYNLNALLEQLNVCHHVLTGYNFSVGTSSGGLQPYAVMFAELGF